MAHVWSHSHQGVSGALRGVLIYFREEAGCQWMAGLGVWLERVPGLVHRKRSAGIYPLPSVGQKGQKVEQECRAWVRHKPDFACFSHPVLTDNNACGVCVPVV